jgi:hypothetical protein
MRRLQDWWNGLVWVAESNPPQFVEFVMLVLAIALLLIWGSTDLLWGIKKGWPFLVLSLSYAVGAAVSTLVRESLVPSPNPRPVQITAVLLLIISFYSFTDLLRYF